MTTLVLLLLGIMPAEPVPAADGADTVVVCPAAFREALQPWLEYRSRQGHSFAMVPNTGAPDVIRRRIRQVGQAGRLRFVLLVGDADIGSDADPGLRQRCVPVHRAEARVNVLWGSEPHIATDNWYADLDDDQTPDVAIGRLTADSPAELSRIVGKILDYERSVDFGPWRRKLNFVAGVGGFSPLADMVLESSVRYLLTQEIPADYDMSMTYGSWRSPYCPDPRSFHATTLRRLNEGSWFWVYIGHGHHLGLDRIRVPGESYHILGNQDVPKIHCEHGAPIALFLACYTGAFDAKTDCLAEQMLRQPQGPVAMIAASRVAMPYAMTVLATGLMDQCFKQRCPTLGEALLNAKRKMVEKPDAQDARRAMLDSIARAVSPAPKQLAAELAEHLLLFNLIGDPLLRLRHPRTVALDVPSTATAGKPLKVTGTSPMQGRATVELVVRRDRFTFSPPRRREYPQTSGTLAEFQEIYQRANDRRLTSVEVPVAAGPFAVELETPDNARGTCHVRVFVEGADDFALGAADVVIAAQ
ncbi:MAG: C25 family cysteine peptidase [Thermoguttaceae bacterium]